jgi:hypothetical protein
MFNWLTNAWHGMFGGGQPQQQPAQPRPSPAPTQSVPMQAPQLTNVPIPARPFPQVNFQALAQALQHTQPDLWQRLVNQVNPFDNGRTFSNPNPTNNNSLLQQATHNGLTNLVGNAVVKPVISTAELPINMGKAFTANATNNPQALANARAAEMQSIPGFFASNIMNAGKAIQAFPQAVAADVRGLHGQMPTLQQQQALQQGLSALTHTTVGQMLSPAQAAIDANIPTATQASQAAGYNTNASGAQKYFADPVMGAISTYGLLSGLKGGAEGVKSTVQDNLTYAGLKPAQIIMDTSKLDALNGAKQALATHEDRGAVLNPINHALYQIRDQNGLDFITGSPADRMQRINQYLEQNGQAIQEFQNRPQIAADQVGAVGKNIRGNEPAGIQSVKQIIADKQAGVPVAAAEKPGAVAPEGQKLSRFANVTVQNSEKVLPEVKKLVDEKNVAYTPQAMKIGQAQASDFVKSTPIDKATLAINKTLDPTTTPLGNITRQDVFNAQAVASKLQQAGKPEDLAQASDIYAKLSAHHTAAGQQIQAAAALAKQTPEGMLYSATKELQKNGVKMEGKVGDTVNKAIKDYKNATKGIPKNSDGTVKNTVNLTREQADTQSLAYQKFVKTVNEQIPRSKGAAGLGIWRADLLTGPETAAKVGVSHMVTAPVELASKPVSSLVDRAVSTLVPNKALAFLNRKNSGYTPGDRGYTFNPVTDTANFIKGQGRGYVGAGIKLKSGLDLPGTGGFDQKMGNSARETWVEKAAGRLHAALPKPNYTAEHELSLGEQARTAAINQGLKGTAKSDFIKNFVNKPSPEALQIAQTAAQKFTNMNETLLGKAASGIQKTPYVGKILAPFARVPGAIGTKALVDWSPLGLGKAAMNVVNGIRKGNFDQRSFSQTVGRSLTGSAAGGVVGYELMQHGRMSLAAPNDPKEKALWLAEGKQANSIYVGGSVSKNAGGTSKYTGGKWLSLNAFGPLGITWGLGGSYQAARAQGKDIPSSIVQAASGGGKVLASQPYLKGIAGVANAVNDPTRYAQQFYDSTVGSLIPAAVSQTARGTDTMQRQYTPGVTNTLKSEIPGQRQKLPIQKDLYGNNVPTGNNGILGGILGTVNPFYPSTPRNQQDPVTQELQRLYSTAGSAGTPSIGAPNKSATINGKKVTMTPQQLNAYIGGSGSLIHTGVANLLNNPDYQKLTDAQKTSQINDIITGAHTATKVAQMGDNPKTLTAADRTAITNPSGLGKDVNVPGLTLGQGIQPADKALLTKVYGMSSTARSAYLNDPKNNYNYQLSSFNNNVLQNKYTPEQQFTQQKTLAKQAVTSNFPDTVTQLYNMSLADQAKFLQNAPNTSQLVQQVYQLDSQLQQNGIIAKSKYATSSPTSGGSSTKATSFKIKLPTVSKTAKKMPKISGYSKLKTKSMKTAGLRVEKLKKIPIA